MNREDKVTVTPQHPTEREEQNRQAVAERSDEERRATLVGRIVFFGSILAVFATVVYALYYFQTGIWQVLVRATGMILSLAFLVLARWLVRRGRLNAGAYLILFAVLVVYGASE
jgi:cation transport ATPase